MYTSVSTMPRRDGRAYQLARVTDQPHELYMKRRRRETRAEEVEEKLVIRRTVTRNNNLILTPPDALAGSGQNGGAWGMAIWSRRPMMWCTPIGQLPITRMAPVKSAFPNSFSVFSFERIFFTVFGNQIHFSLGSNLASWWRAMTAGVTVDWMGRGCIDDVAGMG